MLYTARSSAWLLCVLFLCLPKVFAQQTSKPPKRVFTPEEIAHQQQYKLWETNYRSLQAQGKQVYDTEVAREQAKDCPNANSDSDFDVCIGQLITITDGALSSYEQVIRGLQAPQPKMPGEAAPPANTSLGATPAQSLAQFNEVEQSWEQYRKVACKAAYDQFYGGSGAGGFGAQCRLQLTRDHIRELHMIYGEDFL